MTDKEILDSIYNDAVNGMTVLADTYADIVCRIVCEVLSDKADPSEIEECVCDSFMAFYNNIDDVDLYRGSIIGYLGVIARRRAINLYYTLNPDDETVFDEYTVEEMSDDLEDVVSEEKSEIATAVLAYCLKEIAPEYTEYEEVYEDEPIYEEEQMQQEEPEEETEDDSDVIIKEKSSVFGRVLKTLVAMVSLVLVITVGVIVVDKINTARQDATTTTQTTTQAQSNNPLLSAILAGNEKLIEQLITNSLLLSQDVLKFAVESADKISYDSIRRIAEEVRSKYGSTGLDPILDGAIFGDFQSVRDALQGKDESDMTPAERLAYFFVTNFSNAGG